MRANLTQTQPFAATFGAKQTRKRPRLSSESYNDLLDRAEDITVKCALVARCISLRYG